VRGLCALLLRLALVGVLLSEVRGVKVQSLATSDDDAALSTRSFS
jgi:hypothetical protein